LTDRHPPLEQDDIDRRHNVWWINTAHTFAQEALDRGGPRGQAFKSYQLFMCPCRCCITHAHPLGEGGW
jgi:hypothetical protein